MSWGPLLAETTEGLGVEWRLDHQWPVAGVVMLLLGVLLATWAAWAYVRVRGLDRRRAGALAALRAGGLLGILALLGGWSITRFETDLPDLIILVDASESMTLPAGDSASQLDRSRWDEVRDLLSAGDAQLLRRLSRAYRVQLRRADRADAALLPVAKDPAEGWAEIEPDGPSSPLGESLARVVERQRGRPTAAVVLISDGVVTEGRSLADAATLAAERRLPIISVLAGSERRPPDVVVAEVVADSVAMVGDRVEVQSLIRVTSPTEVRTEVRLRDLDSGETLDRQSLVVPAGRAAAETGAAIPVLLSFTASEAGSRRLLVEVSPLPGERSREDNQRQIALEVRDESIRVLLVQDQPSYEFRFLKPLLERATVSDGSRRLVELTSVLQSGDPRYADQDLSAARLPPVAGEAFEQLDVVILSDCDPAQLGEVFLSQLAARVTEGGLGLAVVAGPHHLPAALAGTPVGNLLPVEPEGITAPRGAVSEPLRLRLTRLGEGEGALRLADDPALWATLPPIYWLAEAAAIRPAAQVLVTTPDRSGRVGGESPVMVRQAAGAGQVWLQLTDEMFRLHARDPSGALHERYWLQLVRSLARGRHQSDRRGIELEVEGDRFAEGARVGLLAHLGSDVSLPEEGTVDVRLVGPEGATSTLRLQRDRDPRRFRGSTDPLDPGSYRAVVVAPSVEGPPAAASFSVRGAPGELSRPHSDAVAMAEAARISDGAMLTLSAAAQELPRVLPPGRQVRLRELPSEPVWNHVAVVALLMGILCTEWWLRRRWGLV